MTKRMMMLMLRRQVRRRGIVEEARKVERKVIKA